MIRRNPDECSSRQFDLIIIGGGIYGAMLAMEASSRGLKALLLEKSDFGGATSFNSLRIVHGGLRYLQSADFQRFSESVQERSWLLQVFPDLVQPLPCMMPLYNAGLRRVSVMRMVLRFNDFLSRHRNDGIEAAARLPDSRILGPAETQSIFPLADTAGLAGSAVWYDALVADSHRLLLEVLRMACARGSAALNYLEVTDLLSERGVISGVLGVDHETGTMCEFRSSTIVNAAGPWCRQLAGRLAGQCPPSLFYPSLAWNVLFDRPAVSTHALAVSHRNGRGQTYFLVPWKGRLMAGTVHAPVTDNRVDTRLSDPDTHMFLSELNEIVPGLDLTPGDILRLFVGMLPVTHPGSTALKKREVIVDHGNLGGPRGLFSVSGVKFTTSRLVARKSLDQIFPGASHARSSWNQLQRQPVARESWDIEASAPALDADPAELQRRLRQLAREESALHLDDLVVRRTTLWEHPVEALEFCSDPDDFLGFDQTRRRGELQRLREALQIGVPAQT